MKTFWNTAFRKRDYECTQIIAIKSERLPKGYDPAIWKSNGMEVREGIELRRIGIVHQCGESFEQYGYL